MPFCTVCWLNYKADGPHLTSQIHNRPPKRHCTQCKQRFTSKYAKQRHFQKSSCNPPPSSGHRCWDCNKVFFKAKKLFKHKRKKCYGRPQGTAPKSSAVKFCVLCNRGFKNAAGLRSHNSSGVHKVPPTGNIEYTGDFAVFNHLYTATAGTGITNGNGTNSTGWSENKPVEDSDSTDDGSSDTDSDSDYTPAEGTIAPHPGQITGDPGATNRFTPAEGTVTPTEDTNAPSHSTSSLGRDYSIFMPTEGSGSSNDFLRTPAERTMGGNYDASYLNLVGPVYAPSYQNRPMRFSAARTDAQNRGVPHFYLNNPAARPSHGLGDYLGGNVINNPAFQSPAGGYYDTSAVQNSLQYQNFVSQPIADTGQVSAPRSRNKYGRRSCQLCPPNRKPFKTEKSLQMHLQSKVHTPVIHRVPQPGENKGEKSHPIIPSFFAPTGQYYVKPIAHSSGRSTVDLVNEGLSGLSLTDEPQEVSASYTPPGGLGLKGFRSMRSEAEE